VTIRFIQCRSYEGVELCLYYSFCIHEVHSNFALSPSGRQSFSRWNVSRHALYLTCSKLFMDILNTLYIYIYIYMYTQSFSSRSVISQVLA
jgi:hypothetical protein